MHHSILLAGSVYVDWWNGTGFLLHRLSACCWQGNNWHSKRFFSSLLRLQYMSLWDLTLDIILHYISTWCAFVHLYIFYYSDSVEYNEKWNKSRNNPNEAFVFYMSAEKWNQFKRSNDLLWLKIMSMIPKIDWPNTYNHLNHTSLSIKIWFWFSSFPLVSCNDG